MLNQELANQSPWLHIYIWRVVVLLLNWDLRPPLGLMVQSDQRCMTVADPAQLCRLKEELIFHFKFHHNFHGHRYQRMQTGSGIKCKLLRLLSVRFGEPEAMNQPSSVAGLA